jgi:HSP20 family molecular chaperone IbpA
MQTELIHSMHEQVRAIYRALTGEDVSDGAFDERTTTEDTAETDETITRRFAELELLARTFPSVVERVPPFFFSPAMDVIAGDDAVVLELALPGVDRDDITIQCASGALTINGVRGEARDKLFHAEIPRGPFCRVVPLPFAIEGEPRSELDRGVLRIYLTATRQSAEFPQPQQAEHGRHET